jgi:hypothetical protein
VPPIVAQKREIMRKRSRRNEEVEVTHEFASTPQFAAKPTKAAAGFLVQSQNRDPFHEPLQLSLAVAGLFGEVNALPEFGNRDDANSQTLGLNLFEAARAVRDAVGGR